MTNREIIIKEVKENNLERINNGIKEFGITAQELFEKTSINRSLISHCLSVLNKEGKIIKINTRPVYFIDLEIFPAKKLFPDPAEPTIRMDKPFGGYFTAILHCSI